MVVRSGWTLLDKWTIFKQALEEVVYHHTLLFILRCRLLLARTSSDNGIQHLKGAALSHSDVITTKVLQKKLHQLDLTLALILTPLVHLITVRINIVSINKSMSSFNTRCAHFLTFTFMSSYAMTLLWKKSHFRISMTKLYR